MRSETLIPLDRVHPPSRDTRDGDHIEIDRQVAEYLARGGKINRVDHTANNTHNQPIIRNRRDQVAWAKRHNRISSKGLDTPV